LSRQRLQRAAETTPEVFQPCFVARAALVASISVVGAVGTASAAPPATGTGTLEICKVASGKGVTGSFDFKVEGRQGTIEVPVGAATVTEVARTDARLLSIATTPRDRLVGAPDLNGRTATVRIVTFTNKHVPPPPRTGLVKICKHPGLGVTKGTTFTFTLATRATKSVDVKARFCSLPQEVPVGNLTVTEKATTGLQVSDITVEPASGHPPPLQRGQGPGRTTRLPQPQGRRPQDLQRQGRPPQGRPPQAPSPRALASSLSRGSLGSRRRR
jgi:hypothetical protein